MKVLGTEGRGLDPKKQMLNNEWNLTNPSPQHPCSQSGLLTTSKLGPYHKSDFWCYCVVLYSPPTPISICVALTSPQCYLWLLVYAVSSLLKLAYLSNNVWYLQGEESISEASLCITVHSPRVTSPSPVLHGVGGVFPDCFLYLREAKGKANKKVLNS